MCFMYFSLFYTGDRNHKEFITFPITFVPLCVFLPSLTGLTFTVSCPTSRLPVFHSWHQSKDLKMKIYSENILQFKIFFTNGTYIHNLFH